MLFAVQIHRQFSSSANQKSATTRRVNDDLHLMHSYANDNRVGLPFPRNVMEQKDSQLHANANAKKSIMAIILC